MIRRVIRTMHRRVWSLFKRNQQRKVPRNVLLEREERVLHLNETLKAIEILTRRKIFLYRRHNSVSQEDLGSVRGIMIISL
jgi:uncharacterized protein (UPF0276 family)